MSNRSGYSRGFTRTATFVQTQIRSATEQRGFAQSKVLTHWPEIAGDQIASISRPVEIKYDRHGLGATLVLLTTGANAPMLEMQKEALRTKVNAIYGYNAIAKIRITQTAATGFAEGRANFEHAPKKHPPVPDAEVIERAASAAGNIRDSDLQRALETLGRNVLSKTKSQRSN